VPRAIEVAVTERARVLDKWGQGLAVRSSAVGEGGARTYAGQYLSLINVPPERVLDAYKRVVASRFSERALAYRLSTGLLEVDSPMAVLVLPVIRARASGIMYSRDPGDPASKLAWVSATIGLGMDIASGRTGADLFVVERGRPHRIPERVIISKEERLVLQPGGGLGRQRLSASDAGSPALEDSEVAALAAFAMRIEAHFGVAQDIEWVIDEEGRPWILQSRPLALAGGERARARTRIKEEPVLSGGRTIYPGQVSGKAFLIEDARGIDAAPDGAVVFIRRPSPEIVEVFPRISGLVAECGNVAGHGAALLREFKIPSVFLMTGAFDRLKTGDPVSFDAVQARVFTGTLFPPRRIQFTVAEKYREKTGDPMSRRLLALHLVDPAASNFRPSGCQSAHDVLRYCHEKAIEEMFAAGDLSAGKSARLSRHLRTTVPVNIDVLDLGGGLASGSLPKGPVSPDEIVSRPFRALWKGVSHPAVTWVREMPAGLGDLA
jgi:pyruvate,water dikinase